MKNRLVILFIFLFFGCTLPKNDRLQPEDKSLSINELCLHINYVIKELQSQGFSCVIEKPKKNQITIPVKINGKKGKFLLDTGASYTFLGKRYLKRFHLSEFAYAEGRNPLIKTFLGGIINDSFPTKADKFEIGNQIFQPWPFIVNKLSPPMKQGVIGVDFLHFTSSVIICRLGALLLSSDGQPAKDIGCKLKELGYTEIELLTKQSSGCIKIKRKMEEYDRFLSSGTFVVPVSFDESRGMAMLDTGAPYTSIDKFIAKKINKRIKYSPNVKATDAKGNRTRIASISLTNLCIGAYCIEKQPVAVIDFSSAREKGKAKAKSFFTAMIGFDILAKNNAIIDFGNRRLYMRK